MSVESRLDGLRDSVGDLEDARDGILERLEALELDLRGVMDWVAEQREKAEAGNEHAVSEWLAGQPWPGEQ